MPAPVVTVINQATNDTQLVELTEKYILLAPAGGTPLVATNFQECALCFSAADIAGAQVEDHPYFLYDEESQVYWGSPLKTGLYIAAETGTTPADKVRVVVAL